MDKNSKIYVAGHTGLVGSAIWKSLQMKGYNKLIGRTINEPDLMDPAAVDSFLILKSPNMFFWLPQKLEVLLQTILTEVNLFMKT